MLQFFRNIFKSKVGLLVTLGLLAVIALAFVLGDVERKAANGGISNDDVVAVVGKGKISTADLSRAATQALERQRQQNPTLSMPAFLAAGGLDTVLNQMIDREAIAQYAETQGFRAGDNLINSEIRKIGAFRGPDGNFSPEIYKQAIAAQGLTDASVRQDLSRSLLAQLALEPATTAVGYPALAARRYAELFKERRIGNVAYVPSAAFVPAGEPDQATLERFYQGARARFIRPERRELRYATFGPEVVAGKYAPTPAQIAARYARDKVKYTASEKRSFTQLIVPTQQAAEAIRTRVSGGLTLDAAAQAAGLKTSALPLSDRAAIKSAASDAVVAAYFGAAKGALTAPARSPLGWHIARVDAIVADAGKTLAQATPEITAALTKENETKALSDLSAGIEQQLDGGATLADVAKEHGLTVMTTGQLTGDGQGYGGSLPAPPVLAPAIATAFQMDESAPQVGQVPGSQQFVIYEVTKITPSTVAPLAEIRGDVVAAWRLAEGAKGAKAAATQIVALAAKGQPLASAVAAVKPGLPAVAPINLSREELAAKAQNGRVPPHLALMFSMAQGTTKMLAAPQDSGVYVIDLDTVQVGQLAPNDPLAAQARQELASAISAELTQQAIAAMRKAVGVQTNAAAIAGLRKQLTGGN